MQGTGRKRPISPILRNRQEPPFKKAKKNEQQLTASATQVARVIQKAEVARVNQEGIIALQAAEPVSAIQKTGIEEDEEIVGLFKEFSIIGQK